MEWIKNGVVLKPSLDVVSAITCDIWNSKYERNLHIKGVNCKYKEALLDFIIWYFSLRYRFPSASLRFTPNTGLYTHISPCSLPNGQPYLSNILQSSPILSHYLRGVLTLVCRPVRMPGGGDTKLEL